MAVKPENASRFWACVLVMSLASTFATSLAAAHDAAMSMESDAKESREAATVRVTPAAAGAVAVLEQFSAALAAGHIDKAADLLDPGVIILESGGAERSRDEYLQSHAAADAAFLSGARVLLTRRTASASGDLAWVASESVITSQSGRAPSRLASTETAVLRHTSNGWRIVHIHWSSRRLDARH